MGDNIHQILENLQKEMEPLCEDMIGVSSAIAGIGALVYICYRVWKHIARAEQIDVFPLLRPFALGLCIMFFNTLVIGTLNGILKPISIVTENMMNNQGFNIREYQQKRNQLERESQTEDVTDYYTEENPELEKLFSTLGMADEDGVVLSNMYSGRRGFGIKATAQKIVRWFLEIIFKAASIIIDCIRSFYLVVLCIFGPLAFGISVFDGFQNTITQWLTKYITIYLWLPISNIFGAILSRIQILTIEREMDMFMDNPKYVFDPGNAIYLVFLLVGICGYFAVPSISNWIVQAGGFGNALRGANISGQFVGNRMAGASGAVVGNTAGNVMGKGSFKNTQV